MALLTLAVFLLGSNYCLLSAWSGNTRMLCMSAPAAKAGPVCSHCGPAHHAPGAPDHTAGRSCCPPPALAPSLVSLDGNVAVAAQLPALNAVLLAHDVPQLTSTWFGHPPLHDGQPPTPLVRALLGARAPPLA
jgi:hypothetical protein